MNKKSQENSQAPASLPEIDPEETFRFACGPALPCFNRCCAKLTLPLTPYDVVRLCHRLSLPSSEFLRLYTGRRPERETGFFSFHLRMLETPKAPCPFVRPSGCSVYEDRPGACRLYPLGRGARLSREGISERFFLIRERHCRGFEAGPERSAQEWFAEQGLKQYNYFNDRYMRLLSLVAASGLPLDRRLAAMSVLCLWQIDRFRESIISMNLFSYLAIDADMHALCLEKSVAGSEACLDFGISWLEFSIFGSTGGLKGKPACRSAGKAG